MANPFDLRGPEFLVFYLILGVAVNMLLRFLISRKEKQNVPGHWDSTDPYKIAYLRAGINEALRVALFSLIDRGLLKATDVYVQAEQKAKDLVKRPIEKAIVNLFDKPTDVKSLYLDSTAGRVGEDYQRQLAVEWLIADSDILQSRMPLALCALCLLIGVSATKIYVAIQRGHYNVLFLILLTFLFTLWAGATWRKNRTGAGDEIMARLESRFSALKKHAGRMRPGGMTNDAAFLAAIFGLTALPNDYFPYVKKLFPQASSAIGDTGSSGGCGSSGCGGGGCGGGGCGGCGG